MALRKVGSVDLDTGEVLDGAVLGIMFPKRRNGFSAWFAMNQEQDFLQILQDPSLQGRDYKVLFALLAFLQVDNWIYVSKADVGRKLGMDRSQVGRSVRKLKEIGILLEGPKVGRSVTYRLSPTFGWKGSAKSHNEALEARMKERGFTVIDNSK